MRTTKPVSTISFNTTTYLKTKLNELVRAHRLSFWAFIQHKPEDDEGGKKTHIHVYIEPAKMLQTDDLKDELKEFDTMHPDKPRTCITFVTSNFSNWYMYGLHDRRYLASKGQTRRFHYTQGEFQYSDEDDFLFHVGSIDLMSLSPYADMIDAQTNGLTWSQYFSRGTVPIQQISAFEHAWAMLLEEVTYRNGRAGHDEDD